MVVVTLRADELTQAKGTEKEEKRVKGETLEARQFEEQREQS